MKVIIDDKIPFIARVAEKLFDEVVYLPGAEFKNRAEVKDADALIVRTRTHCDRALLGGSKVKFIATATIGFDHINADDLRTLGIEWTNCPGCNASSVGQYVRNCLALICQRDGCRMEDFTVGVVGYGHVGKQVCKALKNAGCKLLVNDPPLAETGGADVDLVSLEELARHCNVITFHTPLITDGAHPTYHLADEAFFGKVACHPVIINAARGGVVDEQALQRASGDKRVGDMIIDTWEGEPHIDLALMNKAFVATPHIAGYSADGKSNATRMALRAVCRFFEIPIADEKEFIELTAPPSLPADCVPTGDVMTDWLRLYNPADDSMRLKHNPEMFEKLRGNYPLRRETF